jgi:AraC-like DNA-binding protein
LRKESPLANIETPLTVAQIAVLMGFSRQTVTRLFRHEQGVLAINRPTQNRKRRSCSIRIPRAIYDRVVRRLTL